jgi:streptogramin lyase
VAATPDPTPEPPRVTTFEKVAFRPRGVAIANGDAWVISTHEREIARVDAATGSRSAHEQWIGRGPSAIAHDGQMIWIAARRRSALMGIDARTGRTREFTPMDVPPYRVAAGRSGVWVAARLEPDGPSELFRFDRNGEVLLYRRSFADGIAAITLGGGHLWIALQQQHRIVRIRPGSNPEHGAWLNGPAAELAYGAGHLWASVQPDDSVEKIHPRTENTVDSALVRRPEQLTVAHGRVWVASSTTDRVAVINPRTGERVKWVEVPAHPYGVASGAGGIWVTSIGTGSLTRIDP